MDCTNQARYIDNFGGGDVRNMLLNLGLNIIAGIS